MDWILLPQRKKLLIRRLRIMFWTSYEVKVHTRYITEVKWMCGIEMGENCNKSKKE